MSVVLCPIKILKMKLITSAVLVVVLIVCVADIQAVASPFWDKLFGGNDYTYGNGYSRPRSYGRNYNSGDGGDRYKAICRVHAIDSFSFPGQISRPVCP
ncbi:hypothetical protein D910_04549 [Dendroctonus ponderosae]